MQSDREPIWTDRQAIWRVVQLQYQGAGGPTIDAAVKLVADIYWLTDESIRSEMLRMIKLNGDGRSTVVADAVARRRQAVA